MKPFLIHSDFVYSRALLFSWESDSNPTSLTQTNGQYFLKRAQEMLAVHSCKVLLLNCNLVSDVDDHFIKPLIELVMQKKLSIVFYSSDKQNELISHLEEHLSEQDYPNQLTKRSSGTRFFHFYSEKLCEAKWDEIKENAEKLELDSIKKLVHSAFVSVGDGIKLSSSPIHASGHFNATKLLSHPEKYRWIVLLLSELVNRVLIENKQSPQFAIVAGSLRGSILAGAIKEILDYIWEPKFIIFDHLGPKHNFSQNPRQEKLPKDFPCIYIGDFMIGGTELKLAQVHTSLLGGNLNIAFLVGKYTQLNTLNDQIGLNSLVQLSDCCPDLSYKLV